MPTRRAPFALLLVLLISTTAGAAQQVPVPSDSARAQIHTSLRAFYFSLAHRDWEALTAGILPAKVVAHRPTPEALLTAVIPPTRPPPTHAAGSSPAADDRVACPSKETALLEQATITLDGEWAEVSVPHCTAGSFGRDEFRLIHFEERWRLVYIALFPTVNESTGR